MRADALIARIEATAPPRLAAQWDKCGVQIAATAAHVETLCVALDPTVETVRQAVELEAQFLLCHHPLTLSPKLPSRLDDYHRILSLSFRHDMWVYGAHTSLDANPHGPVNWLGRTLGLRDMRILEVTTRETPTMFTLSRQLDGDAAAQFAAGMLDDTRYLLWPEDAATFRRQLDPAASHAEWPAAAPVREFGFGCIGTLPGVLSWDEFSAAMGPYLTGNPRMVGSVPDCIATVAYCPGSGADLAAHAFRQGADVFLTGDLKYHQAQAVETLGLTLDVGHFCLEETMMRVWSEALSEDLADQNVRVVFLPGHDPFA